MTKEGSTKIVNIMTPRAGVLVLWRGHISHLVKMGYFFQNLLLYSQALIRQTKYIIMMTKEGSTKIVNFNTPMAEVLMLKHGHRICIIFYSINIQHIDCYCVKGL